MSASLGDRFKAWLQYLLPQHLISRGTHRLTRIQHRGFKDWAIHDFARRFGVDMSEALEPDLGSYLHFNAFFTRALKADARPIAAGAKDVASPVDGTVSQIGAIEAGRIFQAKGQSFSALELLGGDAKAAAPFEHGQFTTLYLSPRDYHRIHMPLDGTLTRMIHVPGRLFSVNPPTTRAVPRLFARNERVACLFDTAAGPMALVMVGALNVASIETVWAGEITPPQRSSVQTWDYAKNEIRLAKGAEVGRFNMGSTVILLFARDGIRWDGSYQAASAVRMGQKLASLI
ncbi:MAG TPA: archaetidylserine decarboxylase [Gammaproteobacteria bacterium]|jgi:phosphatidylserine decarboxylase|nr:archaetidylserine decarboxylase [Gammaproteobacteria bacterium]